MDRVEIDQDENSTSSSNQTVFAFSQFALQVQQLDPEEYEGQTFSVSLGAVEEARKDNGTINPEDLITSELERSTNLKQNPQTKRDIEGVQNKEDASDATASLHLPEDLLDLCGDVKFNSTSSTPQRLSYSVFKSDILFQNFNQSHLSIGSIIIAARLRCANNVTSNLSIASAFQIDRAVKNSEKSRDTNKFYFQFICRLKRSPLAVHVQCGIKVASVKCF